MADSWFELAEVLECFSVPAVAARRDGVIVQANSAALSVFEYFELELQGRHLRSICSASDDSAHVDAPARCTSKTGTRFVAHVTSLRAGSPDEPFDIHLFRDIHGTPPIGQEFEDSLLRIARAPEFSAGDFEEAARLLTETVARALGLERVSVWLLTDDREYLDCVSLYELGRGAHSQGLRLSAKDYPAYFRALEESRSIAADDAARDPRTAEFASDYLPGLGIGSMLDAVIRVSGEMVGVVCHEHVGEPRRFQRDEITFAAEVADQAAHAYLVSKHRQAQVERDRLESELQQAQRLEAVGRLAGGVAHDFNNLLSAVLGFAELGLETADSETRECLEEIREAGTRAADLTSQLLSVGRKQVLRRRTLDANVLVRDLRNLLRSVVPESVELVVSLSSRPALVYADRGQLEQVLMNLCLNARDAIGRDGRITVGTRIDSTLEGGDWVVLSVEDDGTGIPDDVREHIFDPFFTTKDEGQGTGLGLPMVYGIAAQHGGTVNVVSRPGAGARFEVRLPLDRSEAPALPRPTAARTLAPGRAHGHVLVAEDGDPLRRLIKSLLEHAGYRVTLANDGVDVVERHRADSGAFDLVVLDVIMPRRGGPAALELIRESEPDLPVLFMTGYGAASLSPEVVNREGVEVLLKPFQASQLLRAVELCVRSPRSSTAGLEPS